MRVDGTIPAEIERSIHHLSQLSGSPQHKEWSIVRGVTIVEGCVDRIIDRLTAEEDRKLTPFGSYWRKQAKSDIDSWNSRFTLLSSGFEVRLNPESSVQSFKLLIELRNALVHGGGYLTARQVRDVGKAVSFRREVLARFDVVVQGRAINLSALEGAMVLEALCDYLVALGSALTNRPELYY